MEFLVVLAVLLIVVAVVSTPLRREWGNRRERRDDDDAEADITRELRELEAARDAKYREIRDAELDHQTGKLSAEDYEALDRSLRADAVEILHRLDRARDRLAATIPDR